ncbi:TPA: conserved hypothetical protein [Aquificae Joseph's Coat Spring virus]|nr:TPA: conserved hypothetical protein [Aquificae Joseph's Coat Spring virus]
MGGLSNLELNLLKTPLPYISGDFVELNESANIIFPQVLNSTTAVYSLNGVSFYDGYEINNKIYYAYNQSGTDQVLYSLSTVYQTPNFAGFCVFGTNYFTFYNSNSCLVINTTNNASNTVSIQIDGATQNIVKAYQITPQLFALVTTNPTTVYIMGLDSVGAIANASPSSTVSLTAYSYATFSNPTVKIDLVNVNNLKFTLEYGYPPINVLYLIGDDYTVVLKLDIRDLIYLQTVESFNYRFTPFQQYEKAGLKFMRETHSFYVFYNTLWSSFVYITKDFKNMYLGENTIYITPNLCLNITNNTFYQFTDILQNDTIVIPSMHNISFRVDTPLTLLSQLFIDIPETQIGNSSTIATFNIETRYQNQYNNFSYNILYNYPTYRLGVRGSSFVLGLSSSLGMRITNMVLS